MLNRLRTLLGPAPSGPLPAIPPGERVYAVGDIHGRLDLFEAAIAAIEADDAACRPAQTTVILLGDLIDRGPDSAGVLNHILHTQNRLPTVTLLGNHEAMLLDTLATPDRARAERRAQHWMGHGGAAALQSWGVPGRAAVDEWSRLIPPAHLALLRSLRLHWTAGRCLFVHAGVRPGVAWASQARTDLLYMRDPFLRHRGPPLPDAPDRFVVHGHTPGPVPVVKRWRLCVDTGAGAGGSLTCAVIGRDQVRFLRA